MGVSRTLTEYEQYREPFERDGFVALPQFVSGARLTEIEANLQRFINEVVPKLPRDDVFYEDRGDRHTLKQIQRMHQRDEFFEQLSTDSEFRRLAEAVLDDEVVLKNVQYFNKPASVGRPTPPHQDGFYFKLDPPEAVTLWLALDRADELNGCVRYVPGSHREGMREHGRSDTLGFSQTIVDFGRPEEREREVAIVAQPGDLLAHHALTIHRADGNPSTERGRRSLGLIYYARKAREDTAAIAEYRQKLADEMVAAGQI